MRFGCQLSVISYPWEWSFRTTARGARVSRLRARVRRAREVGGQDQRSFRSELVVILMRANPSPKKRVRFDEMTYSAIMVADSYGPLPGFDRPKP
jgi:hypothetical protein